MGFAPWVQRAEKGLKAEVRLNLVALTDCMRGKAPLSLSGLQMEWLI